MTAGEPGQDMQHNLEVFAVQLGQPPGAQLRRVEGRGHRLSAAHGGPRRRHQVLKDDECLTGCYKDRSVIPIVTLDTGRAAAGSGQVEEGEEGEEES